jgi:hypothetical protein
MAARNKTPSIGKAVAEVWLAVTRQLFDSYHPERHYMRGPGPKWHARYARPVITAECDLDGMATVSA